MDEAAFRVYLRRWGSFGLYGAGLINLLAIILLALVLGPALLGRAPARLAYVAAHNTGVEVSWAIWMLATLGLILSLVILAPCLDPRGRHLLRFALAVAVAGAAADWSADLINMTAVPLLAANYLHAATANKPGILLSYQVWDAVARGLTGGVANSAYVLAGFLYVHVMAETAGLPRWLTILGAAVWTAAASASLALVWAPSLLPPTVGASIILYVAWVWLLGRLFIWPKTE